MDFLGNHHFWMKGDNDHEIENGVHTPAYSTYSRQLAQSGILTRYSLSTMSTIILYDLLSFLDAKRLLWSCWDHRFVGDYDNK